VLLLAPYNPGWAARSLAFAFNVQVAATAAEVGLDPARITILGELSVAEAEAALSCADVYLNPFPHGGATMTHLALIYGVPPVTLRRRSTRSIDQFLVSALGFPELLASSPEAYVALAQDLARHPDTRQDIAKRLRKAARHPVFVDSADHSDQMQAAIENAIRQKFKANG
jgi:predicted O-linked N-acetylglucosamine transferase (SPINDLY family)